MGCANTLPMVRAQVIQAGVGCAATVQWYAAPGWRPADWLRAMWNGCALSAMTTLDWPWAGGAVRRELVDEGAHAWGSCFSKGPRGDVQPFTPLRAPQLPPPAAVVPTPLRAARARRSVDRVTRADHCRRHEPRESAAGGRLALLVCASGDELLAGLGRHDARRAAAAAPFQLLDAHGPPAGTQGGKKGGYPGGRV